MIDRRGFVASVLGSASLSGMTRMNNQHSSNLLADDVSPPTCDRNSPFVCSRIVTLFGSHHYNLGEYEVRRRKALHKSFAEGMLKMSPEKVGLLFHMSRILTYAYVDADLDEWFCQSVDRENYASVRPDTHLQLLHHCPGNDKKLTKVRYRSFRPACDVNEPHWWVFLTPEGATYDTIDGSPVYAVFYLVMPELEPLATAKQLFQLVRMTRRIRAQEEAASFWKHLAHQFSDVVADQLNRYWLSP